MDKEHKQRIEELIRDCPPGSKCRDQGVDSLCKAKDVGLQSFVECLEENPLECSFSLAFGDVHYCLCRPRTYIAKIFNM
jgi:hypothetical protein